MALEWLINHDLLGKTFLKLAKFSSFVATPIPRRTLKSEGNHSIAGYF